MAHVTMHEKATMLASSCEGKARRLRSIVKAMSQLESYMVNADALALLRGIQRQIENEADDLSA